MSQIGRLLTKARMTAEESTQDESNFTEMRNKKTIQKGADSNQ